MAEADYKMKLSKILSETEREKQEKKKKTTMTVIIIFVLMASTAAFALTTNQTESVKYKKFVFIKAEQGWNLKNTNLLTTFLPADVENISFKGIKTDDFKRKVYYLAITNSEQTAANEINRAFFTVIEKYQLACPEKYENETFCSELPIKSCETEASDLIIEIEEAENQSISYDGNCISIKGNEMDLMKGADRIIYSAYGVIE